MCGFLLGLMAHTTKSQYFLSVKLLLYLKVIIVMPFSRQALFSNVYFSKPHTFMQIGHFTSPQPNPQQSHDVRKSGVARRKGCCSLMKNPHLLSLKLEWVLFISFSYTPIASSSCLHPCLIALCSLWKGSDNRHFLSVTAEVVPDYSEKQHHSQRLQFSQHGAKTILSPLPELVSFSTCSMLLHEISSFTSSHFFKEFWVLPIEIFCLMQVGKNRYCPTFSHELISITINEAQSYHSKV